MSLFNEYALLFAVAIPVATIVGLQVFLFLGGERGTLLLPGVASYPSIEFGMNATEAVAKPIEMPASASAAAVAEPSNDEMVREAA